MAEENSGNRFESEMTRMMDLVIRKITGLENRFDGLENRFDGLEKDVSQIKMDMREVKTDVKILKAQFSDVAVMAIEDNKRIIKLEKKVEDLQSNIH